jgi:hypothetical protein
VHSLVNHHSVPRIVRRPVDVREVPLQEPKPRGTIKTKASPALEMTIQQGPCSKPEQMERHRLTAKEFHANDQPARP